MFKTRLATKKTKNVTDCWLGFPIWPKVNINGINPDANAKKNVKIINENVPALYIKIWEMKLVAPKYIITTKNRKGTNIL